MKGKVGHGSKKCGNNTCCCSDRGIALTKGGGGGRHKASVLGCLPLAVPIGLSPLLILTLCGSERVLTRGGGGVPPLPSSPTCLGTGPFLDPAFHLLSHFLFPHSTLQTHDSSPAFDRTLVPFLFPPLVQSHEGG